jgi:hypothetical protein
MNKKIKITSLLILHNHVQSGGIVSYSRFKEYLLQYNEITVTLTTMSKASAIKTQKESLILQGFILILGILDEAISKISINIF